MSFITPKEEQYRFKLDSADLLDIDSLNITWETRPDIVERLLPPPLEPFDSPIAQAYIALFRESNFGIRYREAALYLLCKYKKDVGIYVLSMPVDDGLAMAYGREYFGYPKKTSKIGMNRVLNFAFGSVRRHGTTFVKFRASFLRKIDEEKAQEYGLSHNRKSNAFLFKHFVSPDTKSFDYKPRLIKAPVEIHRDTIEVGLGKIKFKPLKTDPWHEVEVVKMLGADYSKGYTKMLPAEVVAEIEDVEKFIPYAYLKWD